MPTMDELKESNDKAEETVRKQKLKNRETEPTRNIIGFDPKPCTDRALSCTNIDPRLRCNVVNIL